MTTMKRILSAFSVALVAVLLVPSVAFAAKPVNAGGGNGGGKPTPTEPPAQTEYKGYDISYPQCGNKNLKNLPTDHYFGIVGVNGGTASTFNSCLTEQLAWANKAKTGFEAHQDRVQLYVNTANPAQDPAYTNWSTWPTSGNTPYGDCAGEKTNDLACSWQYGWNRSVATEAYFISKTPAGMSKNTADYIWWLDVETMNSWQTGSTDALARNRAAIEGFAAYYQSKNAQVGLYSTAYQWGEIVGTSLITDGNLVGLPNWRPGGANLTTAKDACEADPLTSGGHISITQYIVKNLDNNHSCV